MAVKRALRHPLPHTRLARVHAAGGGPEQVAFREDPDQAAPVENDRGADALLDHPLGCFAESVLGRDRDDRAGHQIP